MKKIVDWNSNLLLGIGSFLIGWVASWIVEYFVVSIFGFPTKTCVWFVIKLNIFIISVIIVILGCMAGSYCMKEWTKER